MVKLALTMSSFDRSRPRRHFDSDAAPEPKLGPAAFRVRVASERVALGAVPPAFREWRSHASWRRPGMRVPALMISPFSKGGHVVSNVYDHTGVRIGKATATGEVYDHTGVRIGRVDGEGDVYDHTGVRIGYRGLRPRPI